MKKIIKLFILFLLLLPISFLSSCDEPNIYGNNDLDRINYYEIKVDPCEDGTLNMNYKINWEVLDDDSEGPLTWVIIGVPNKYIDNLKAKSSNIKEIKYTSDDGAHIRIDFNRAYYENERLQFEFSFHLSRMYHIDNDKLKFNFKPGWFDEIIVDQAVVLWNKENVIYENANKETADYYKWEYALNYGDTINVNVTYNKNSFVNISKDLQYSDASLTTQDIILIIVILSVIFIVFVVASIISIIKSDPYMRHRGFIYRRFHSHRWYYHHHYYSYGIKRDGGRIVNPTTSGGHGFVGGRSCACACACAGGGRAGCSRKDFNHGVIDNKKVLKVLKNK